MPNQDNPTQDRLDIDFVRSQFPGLSHGWTFFDNAGGSQILKRAVERINTFLYDKNVPDWRQLRGVAGGRKGAL